MTSIPENRSETVFDDFKKPYTRNQALVEANRCLYCFDAPCITACPTDINIPQFISRISDDNMKGSAKTIFDSNIMGMSCARVCPVETLCVGACVYNKENVPPVQIGKLQRYATDMAFEADWQFYKAGPDSGKSVALIGGGPASLAAAHHLRRYGHAVTIIERDGVIGGLNATGVAPYKMKSDRAIEEVDWLLKIGGIEVRTGVDVPKDVSWSELREQFDAVFIGFGLGRDRFMDVDGADATGIHGAVAYIAKLKLGSVDLSGVNHAVVVGGGNTAVDAVRELAGLGVPNVSMVYRGDESGMSGYAHEWAEAKKEGVIGLWRSQPTGYVVKDGAVAGLRTEAMDENKKPLAGTENVIPTELILLAIGQEKQGGLAQDLPGIQIEWGKVLVNEHGQTGCDGVFAGGDCVNGGKEVVNAVAEGTLAAHGIHSYLTGANNG